MQVRTTFGFIFLLEHVTALFFWYFLQSWEVFLSLDWKRFFVFLLVSGFTDSSFRVFGGKYGMPCRGFGFGGI